MDKKKKTKKPAPKISDLDTEQQRKALLKQKHCDAVALHIVTKLIDCAVEEDVLLQSLKYLSQHHYDDVVEERAITKMCGYPVCAKKIPDLPNQKFHISAKSNKVFDITERKNFCSNFCYTASNHLKDQLLTSPLWYRDQEKIPVFKLMQRNTKVRLGEEIDQGIVRAPKEADPTFTSISQFADDMLQKIPNDYGEEGDSNTDEEILQKPTKTYEEDFEISIEQLENIQIDDNKGECSKNIDENIRNIQVINEEKPKEEIKIPILKDENFFYSKMFTPSLADILKENATYFEKVEETLNKPEPIQEKPEEPKLKSILSNKKKGKAKVSVDSKEKKSVSFGSNIKEPEKTTRVFKRPVVAQKVAQNSKEINTAHQSRVTEDSLINKQVIEHKSVYYSDKSEENKNDSKKLEETETENGKAIDKPVKVDTKCDKNTENDQTNCLLSKPVVEHTTLKLVKKPEVKDEQKEMRKSKFKNSSTYAKAKQLSNQQSTEKFESANNINYVNSSINVNKQKETEVLNEKNIAETVEHKLPVREEKNSQKEKRKLNLRNSATFAKAKQVSKHIEEKENDVKQKTQTEQNESEKKCVPNLNARNTNSDLTKTTNFEEHLEKTVREWLTIDTMIFLYGEEHVKSIISDKTFKQYLNIKKNAQEEEMKKRKYEEICKRLNLMELADKQFDESVKVSGKKPLPNYSDLKEQAETMDLRVRAFYSGCFELYEMENTESDVEEEEDESVEGTPAVLPLVENKDYGPLRKKIFLTSLNRTMPILCDILGQSQSCLMSDVKKLVDTFLFDAHNIVFKTAEWPMVAILLVKMLALQNKELINCFDSKRTQDHVTTLFKILCFKNNNLDNYLLNIVDIHTFLQENLKKTTELV